MATSLCGGVQAMVTCPEFKRFEHTLWEYKSRGATWRNVLAIHTSKCCAPGHARGVTPTLGHCGIDKTNTMPDGRFVTVLHFVDLFDVPKGAACPTEQLVVSGTACDNQVESQEAIRFMISRFMGS